MYLILVAWFNISSQHIPRKSQNLSWATGLIPVMAAPMAEPRIAASASGVSLVYVSVIQVPPSLIGEEIYQLGFAAASGGTAYGDGGWLIDEVIITVTF